MNGPWSRLKTFILCLIAGPAAAAPLVAEDTGLIGAHLPVVEKSSDFFTFFNFARVPGDSSPTMIAFKPTGEAFRALVTLDVTTDDQGIIESLRLEIARSFIDDPKKCIYAADLAKSYLASVGEASTGDVAALAKEISARSFARSGMRILTARPLPTVAGAPSAAYETYAGQVSLQTVSNASGTIQASLQNQVKATEPLLEFTLAAPPRKR